jgi:hypothetical protein
MKVIVLVLSYENYDGYGHIVFILAYGLLLDSYMNRILLHGSYRLWNTNIYDMHRMLWQVHTRYDGNSFIAHELIIFNLAN